MLIQTISYDQFYATGEFIGAFSLTPIEGLIEFPELTEKDIAKIINEYMIRVFPTFKSSYQAGQYCTVFHVCYKVDHEDHRKSTKHLLVTPQNFGSLFPQ